MPLPKLFVSNRTSSIAKGLSIQTAPDSNRIQERMCKYLNPYTPTSSSSASSLVSSPDSVSHIHIKIKTKYL